jgi:hypothetical protein
VYVEVAIFVAEQLEYSELQYTSIVRRADMLEHEMYSSAASREAYETYREQSYAAAQLELIEVFDGIQMHTRDDSGTVQQQQLQQGEPEQRMLVAAVRYVQQLFCKLSQFRACSMCTAVSALMFSLCSVVASILWCVYTVQQCTALPCLSATVKHLLNPRTMLLLYAYIVYTRAYIHLCRRL